MCGRCDYPRLFRSKGVAATPNRLMLMKIVGDGAAPMSPQKIHDALKRTRRVNRATVYRILEPPPPPPFLLPAVRRHGMPRSRQFPTGHPRP